VTDVAVEPFWLLVGGMLSSWDMTFAGKGDGIFQVTPCKVDI
jgi:hypothetical protein